MYNGNFGSLDCGSYAPIDESQSQGTTEKAMSSPQLSRSPLLRAKALKEEDRLLKRIAERGGGGRVYAQDI